MTAAIASAQQDSWRSIATTGLQLLTFRASREDLLNLGARHLLLGLFCSWLVGVGRYYDNPRVGLLQHLGIGSVFYVFVFSLFLWLVIAPLRPSAWRYLRVCAFVALVSPPAILYAIPVERLFRFETANSINAWFLAIVAIWRVALLIFFLRRSTELGRFETFVAVFLPLCLIVVVLSELNLEKAVFSLMGSLVERTSNDVAFATLWTLAVISVLLFVPLLLCYLTLVVVKMVRVRRRRLDEKPT